MEEGRRITHRTEGYRGGETEGGGQENGEGGPGRGGHARGSSQQVATEIRNEFKPGVSKAAGIE